MAGPRTCRSPCWNPLPTGEDELAGAAPRAPTDDSGTLSHTLALSRVTTPVSTLPLTLAKLMAKYTDVDLQRVTKLALKLFVQGQQQA